MLDYAPNALFGNLCYGRWIMPFMLFDAAGINLWALVVMVLFAQHTEHNRKRIVDINSGILSCILLVLKTKLTILSLNEYFTVVWYSVFSTGSIIDRLIDNVHDNRFAAIFGNIGEKHIIMFFVDGYFYSTDSIYKSQPLDENIPPASKWGLYWRIELQCLEFSSNLC